MYKRDFFHDTSSDVLVCGDVNQNLFITIWAIILALDSLYLMIKIGTSFAKAREGEKNAASVLVQFSTFFKIFSLNRQQETKIISNLRSGISCVFQISSSSLCRSVNTCCHDSIFVTSDCLLRDLVPYR